MRPNYKADEVKALIENYATLTEKRDTTPRGLHYLAMIADLDQALARLPLKFYEVVLLHGLLGIPQYEVASILHVSQQAVSKRYRQGLEEVVYVVNGEQD